MRLLTTVCLALAGWAALVTAAPAPGFAESDVERTVQEVRAILKRDPALPRLSDNEILVLLNDIQTADRLKQEKKKNVTAEVVTEEIPVAQASEGLMLVLPFRADSTDGDLTELYTKRPEVAFVVSDSSQRNKEDQTETPTESPRVDEFWKSTRTPSIKNEKVKEDESKVKNKEPNAFKKMPSYEIPSNFEMTGAESYTGVPDSDPEIKFDPADYMNHSEGNDQDSLASSVPATNSAYVEFKPIPAGLINAQAVDVKEFLGDFATETLNEDTDVRSTEAEELPEPLEFAPDTFPAEMTSILTDIGVMKKKGRKLSPIVAVSDETQDVNENLSSGPDPLTFDELTSVDEHAGNELTKRQQPKNATESSTTAAPDKLSDSKDSGSSIASESSDGNASSSDSEKDVGPSLADLESSFGASPADDDPSEAELPPPRKNGFYYMVDWNSFLEVGEGPTRVNIRFDPKLGDPERFIAVNVP